MELREYFGLFIKWLWLIILTTLLATAAAFLVSRQMTPIYRASTTLWINEAKSASMSDYSSLLTSERLARTYSQLMKRRPILDETKQRLGLLDETLGDNVSVQLIRDTQLIELSVEHPIPRLAADIANTIPEVFSEQNEALQASRYESSKQNLTAQMAAVEADIANAQGSLDAATAAPTPDPLEISRLENALAQYRGTYSSLVESYEQIRLAEAGTVDNIVVVEAAVLPAAPVRPRVMQNTLLAAVVGAMIGLGVAFLIEYLDNTIKTPQQVEQILGLTTIGVITQVEGAKDLADVLTNASPKSPVAEAYRVLRTNLQFASVGSEKLVVAVTSPTTGEGKTTTAANLGIAFAQAGSRAVLVDADLRRPTLHKLFGLDNSMGLSNLLVTGMNANDVLSPTSVEGLFLLPSGSRPPNPAELLVHPRMDQVVKDLTDTADVVLIDLPPALAVADATIVASKVQGMLLVVEMAETRIDICQRAIEALQKVDARILGLVINKVSQKGTGYYRYYYPYYYPYQSDDGSPQGRIRRKRRSQGALGRLWRNVFG